jgi:DNA polymerase-3 subunit epsilon
MGFFYTQHRALEDCNAVYHALRYCPPQNGNINCFHLLKANAQQVTYRIPVYNSPFGKKDLLKHRGYRWQETGDKHPKHWFIDLTADRIASEIEYLCKVIYERDLEIIPRQLDAKNRYSVRV